MQPSDPQERQDALSCKSARTSSVIRTSSEVLRFAARSFCIAGCEDSHMLASKE